MLSIREAMDKLQGKTLFSKFDIRHRYNNIRLAKEDRHKAAIQTHHGTYIPEVMYFGMCNAPCYAYGLLLLCTRSTYGLITILAVYETARAYPGISTYVYFSFY